MVTSLQQAILDAADYSMISTDPTGVIQTVNLAAEQMLGYSAVELVGKVTPELIHDRQEIIDRAVSLSAELDRSIAPGFEVFVAKARQGMVSEEEWTYIRKDGSRVPVLLSVTALHNANQDIIGFLGIARDITARKQAELKRQQLIQELSAFKLALDQSTIVTMTDARGVITYVNDRFCEVSGYPRLALIGQTHRVVKSNYHPPAFFQDLWTTISQGGSWRGEICNRAQNGSLYWVDSTVVPCLNPPGQPVQYLAIQVEITARKLVEAAIQQENAFRQQILENMTEGLCVFHAVDEFPWIRFTVWNHQMQAITGYTFEEINQLGWLQALYPDPATHSRAIARMNQIQQGETLVAEEWDIQRKDGHRCTIALSTSVLSVNDLQVHVLALMQDITKRKRAEVQLQQTNDELARATRLKDEFLANMSHELRTPLNAILGMTEGLQEGVFGEITDQQLKALQTIERSGSHLLELINDILDVAKIESGQMELTCAPTVVATLCQSSLIFIKQQAAKKHIQLQVTVPPDLPDLLVDELRMRQVLINLLNNAVKFTPEGGRIIVEAKLHRQVITRQPTPIDGITRVRIYRTPLEDELGLGPQVLPRPEENVWLKNFVRISVMDTGIGIAPDAIDKLFQPFVQIDSALNRQYAGTGLGLALVKRIIELHGGRVSLTSKVGFGSCFTIDLPCVPVAYSCPVPEIQTQSLRFVPQSQLPTSPLILLAEDNEANVTTISSYLTAKGYRLRIAMNGEEAIALALSDAPDLILMDIQMPGMDGLEAIRGIRQYGHLASVPIIALTALAMEGDRDRCLAAGANYYLTKPVKLKQLISVIQQLLAVEDPEAGGIIV